MKKTTHQLSSVQIQELTNYKKASSRSAKEAMRVQAILLFDDGAASKLIKNITEYSKKYASNLRRKYLKRGINSLDDRKGKCPNALLTKGQRLEIIKNITMLTPQAFGFDEVYWTTATLSFLIKEQYNVQYKSRTPITILFKEARFTYHKPDKQYRAKDQNAIDAWKEKYKPIINDAIENEKTVVLVADEMMLSTQTTTQKIWLKKGEFPKIDVSSKRTIRCIYGALNIKNGHEHAFKAKGANSKFSCEFLNQLGDLHKGYKIVLIWDNASWHKSEEVKQFLTKTKHDFYLINFPPYSPELNPQEHVWKEGRKHITHNTFIDNIDKATDAFIHFLNEKIFDYKFI
ncbi:MAG: IS630 family transposase [Candidatus Dependentiae bacterium]|nr:IS630 family transposase [Candidatus Dependentiae bacterium]